MRLLVTGARGQLGWELVRSLLPLGEVIAADRTSLDLARPTALPGVIRTIRPDVIVNAAAYTNVDRAEAEEPLATQINGEAVGALAREARLMGALLIHFSTDYVFDGTKVGAYLPEDQTRPLNAYGRSKRLAEELLLDAGGDWLALRSTWIFSARGNNFLRTILRLARERDSVRVVDDQIGAPTSARWLADVTAHVIRQCVGERSAGRFASGIYHCSAAGSTSWFGFASEILERARRALGADAIRLARIDPIPTAEYPLPAKRPSNSVLDMSSFSTRFAVARTGWREMMERVLDEVFTT